MFRFTIRDVLWLTVVVALAVSWWLHAGRMQLASEAHEIAAKRSASEARFAASQDFVLMKMIVAEKKSLADARFAADQPAIEPATEARIQTAVEARYAILKKRYGKRRSVQTTRHG